jgi:hypothetical protein
MGNIANMFYLPVDNPKYQKISDSPTTCQIPPVTKYLLPVTNCRFSFLSSYFTFELLKLVSSLSRGACDEGSAVSNQILTV